MSEIEIEFTYDGESIIVQYEKDTKLKDIWKIFKFKAKAERNNYYIYIME